MDGFQVEIWSMHSLWGLILGIDLTSLKSLSFLTPDVFFFWYERERLTYEGLPFLQQRANPVAEWFTRLLPSFEVWGLSSRHFHVSTPCLCEFCPVSANSSHIPKIKCAWRKRNKLGLEEKKKLQTSVKSVNISWMLFERQVWFCGRGHLGNGSRPSVALMNQEILNAKFETRPWFSTSIHRKDNIYFSTWH